MNKENKTFNVKLYAVIVFVLIAVVLFAISFVTFKSKYTAFDPEKTAKGFVDTIVSNGDGYDAYKVTLMSKNYKYGDYIREYYMYPLIYADAGYKAGDSTDGLKGLNDDKYKGELTKNDDGSLEGQLIDAMFEDYVKLQGTIGWDNYDEFFTEYFQTLASKRNEIFDDYYLTDEIMFTALEANVKKYGEMVTGTDKKVDENTGAVISEETEGVYQAKFGEDYKIEINADKIENISLDQYKESVDREKLETYKTNPDEISEAKLVHITVDYGKDNCVPIDITVVRIGNSWYVDNTQTKTTDLYKVFAAE